MVCMLGSEIQLGISFGIQTWKRQEAILPKPLKISKKRWSRTIWLSKNSENVNMPILYMKLGKNWAVKLLISLCSHKDENEGEQLGFVSLSPV